MVLQDVTACSLLLVALVVFTVGTHCTETYFSVQTGMGSQKETEERLPSDCAEKYTWRKAYESVLSAVHCVSVYGFLHSAPLSSLSTAPITLLLSFFVARWASALQTKERGVGCEAHMGVCVCVLAHVSRRMCGAYAWSYKRVCVPAVVF